MQSLVDELERLMQTSSRLPVGGKLLIDEASLRRLVEEMRAALPDQQREAQRIAAERERMLADARTQARRIIEDAHAQGGVRLDDQAVVRRRTPARARRDRGGGEDRGADSAPRPTSTS